LIVEWIATEYQQEKSLTGSTGAPCREEKNGEQFYCTSEFSRRTAHAKYQQRNGLLVAQDHAINADKRATGAR
jgi:hypothetical protein